MRRGEDKATGTLSFLDDGGALLSVGVNGKDPATEFPFDIPPQGGAVFTTDGLGDVVGGSARVTVDEGVVGGVLRFTLPGAGIAGVGSSEALTGFIIPVRRDQSNGLNTGVSISSTGMAVATSLTLRHRDGSPVPGGMANLNLAASGHKADFLDVLFPNADTSNFGGTLTVTVDTPSTPERSNSSIAAFQTDRSVPFPSNRSPLASSWRGNSRRPAVVLDWEPLGLRQAVGLNPVRALSPGVKIPFLWTLGILAAIFMGLYRRGPR